MENLLLLFNHYKNYEQLPSDKFKFLDSDQLFVKKVTGNIEDLLPFIGKFHIFLLEQRRIFLPGWFDIDHDENEDWHLLAFITDALRTCIHNFSRLNKVKE